MTQKQARTLNALRIAALAAGVAFVVLGACRGEIAIVLRKAVRICLECIGVAG